MPYGRDKGWRFRTLRFRLMVWNAVVVIATACVTLVALREGVRITLLRELDQVLEEDLREIEGALAAYRDRSDLYAQLDLKDSGHARHKWFAELSTSGGRIDYRSKHAPGDPARRSNGPLTTLTSGEWRVLSKGVPDHGTVVRIGASLEMMRADIARLDRFLALCAAGVLVAAPLGGYWLAGRATRPLARIITTTARLRPSHLDERLDIRGTGDELDRLSVTLNGLLDRIGEYLREHRDFLANSAHELRTPLAAIRASIEVALAGGRTSREYEELLADILDESGSLELLVNQLLLLAETEGERLKAAGESVRVDEMITRAMDMFEGVADYRDIRLECGPLPPAVVHGNRHHLRQVVHNLLDNALKFTPARGEVSVRLDLDSERDEVRFSVSDTGPGIPPSDMPHLFERFFQGNRPRTGAAETRGTGLGLSICQAIVHAHGGVIEAENRDGAGARFTVRLPNGPGLGHRVERDDPPTREYDGTRISA